MFDSRIAVQQAVVAGVIALILFVCPDCAKRARPHVPQSSRTASQPSMPSDFPGFRYPAAQWRLATLDALDHATLWVGHIVIRHESSQVDLFRPPTWRPDPPNPKRTVGDAFVLARKIQAEAILAPEGFERLARQYSEDVVSRDQGGMLGGVRASQLANFDFLDALTALKVGQVSEVFRSPYGFHILKRYAPPADELVSGNRVVIGYEGVYGLSNESHRTRAQALKLAREISLQARANPHNFGTFVDRYSDNIDRIAAGDLGVYSTRDPGYMPTEVQVLTRLMVGQVADPLDSRFGFEILQRVPVVPRKEYAMTAIEVTTRGMGTDKESLMAEAFTVAEELLQKLRIAPERFAEFQKNYCCERVRHWTKGSGNAELTDVLEDLSFGEVTPEPIRRPAGYMLMKRLDPSKVKESPRQFEVPNPTDPDYDVLAVTMGREQLVTAARALISAVRDTSSFNSMTTKAIIETIEKTVTILERDNVDHAGAQAILHAGWASLQLALDAKQFRLFNSFSRQWVIKQMMPPVIGD